MIGDPGTVAQAEDLLSIEPARVGEVDGLERGGRAHIDDQTILVMALVDRGVDALEELAELKGTVPRMILADDAARRDIEGGEQRRPDPISTVVVTLVGTAQCMGARSTRSVRLRVTAELLTYISKLLDERAEGEGLRIRQ